MALGDQMHISSNELKMEESETGVGHAVAVGCPSNSVSHQYLDINYLVVAKF